MIIFNLECLLLISHIISTQIISLSLDSIYFVKIYLLCENLIYFEVKGIFSIIMSLYIILLIINYINK